MRKPLRYVLAGTGEIAGRHARALAAAGGRLVAVHSASPERAARSADALGVHPARTLRDVPADAVLVASSNDRHEALLAEAVDAGLHALIEKPLVLDVPRGEALLARARERGLVVAGVFQRRLLPAVVALRESIRRGELGLALGAECALPWRRDGAYFAAAPWRADPAKSGGGVGMMQAIHDLDLLRHLLGEARVRAALVRRREARGEDVLHALLELEHGAGASVFATTAAGRRQPRRLVLHFERATIGFAGDRLALDTRAPSPGLLARLLQRLRRHDSPSKLALFTAVHADFAQAVEHGRPPVAPGEDALRSVALVQAIYAAAGPSPMAAANEDPAR